MGTYRFKAEQVFSIQRATFPLYAIRIKHNVVDCPERVIFSCWTRPSKLIDQIGGTGFHPNTASLDGLGINCSGLPLRMRFILPSILIWNLLFLGHAYLHPLGYEVHLLWYIALLLPLVSTIGLRLSHRVRAFVIGPAGTYNDVRWFMDTLSFCTIVILVFQILNDYGIIPGATGHG
jgi:hypothetical protein